jgi:hypothetical protein
MPRLQQEFLAKSMIRLLTAKSVQNITAVIVRMLKGARRARRLAVKDALVIRRNLQS